MKKLKFERHFIQKVPEVRTRKDWWFTLKIIMLNWTIFALILSSAIILWQRKQIDKLSQENTNLKNNVEEIMKQMGSGRVLLELGGKK